MHVFGSRANYDIRDKLHDKVIPLCNLGCNNYSWSFVLPFGPAERAAIQPCVLQQHNMAEMGPHFWWWEAHLWHQKLAIYLSLLHSWPLSKSHLVSHHLNWFKSSSDQWHLSHTRIIWGSIQKALITFIPFLRAAVQLQLIGNLGRDLKQGKSRGDCLGPQRAGQKRSARGSIFSCLSEPWVKSKMAVKEDLPVTQTGGILCCQQLIWDLKLRHELKDLPVY